MGFVPHGHQLVGGFADVFGVDDIAAESAGGVEGIFDLSIEAVGDVEGAVKADVGEECPQPLQFDALALTVEGDDGVPPRWNPSTSRSVSD